MTRTQLVGAWGPAALSARDGRIRGRAIAGSARRAVAARATAFDDEMAATVTSLRRPGSGLLAVDESPASAGKRLAGVGLPNTLEHRQRYRHMLLGTPGLSAHVSGAILHEETLHLGPPANVEPTEDNARSSSSPASEHHLLGPWLTSFGIVPGVKLDRGLQPLPGCPGEVWASGLDDLATRCASSYAAGARFAKWRAALSCRRGAGPSERALRLSARGLAQFAACAQAHGLVPVVEPEVLLAGCHGVEAAYETSARALDALVRELFAADVALEATVLKPSFVTAGAESAAQTTAEESAHWTLLALRRHLPPALPMVAFLSGGLSCVAATQHLSALCTLARGEGERKADERERRAAAPSSSSPASPAPSASALSPWHLTYSFARAVQNPALKAWAGRDDRVHEGRRAFLRRCALNSAAQRGDYSQGLEEREGAAAERALQAA